jgi:hypothetical protein
MRVDASEHPTHIGNTEPLSLTEQAVFGVDAVRCPTTGRVYEQGEGSLPREEQTKMFQREAALAERKAAIEQEALRQAEAAAAAEQTAAPALRLVKAKAKGKGKA